VCCRVQQSLTFLQVGDVGLVARISECEFEADGRAYLQATFVREVVVSSHWVEPGSRGLAWCVVQVPTFEPFVQMDRAGQVRALQRFGRMRVACRTSRNGRYVVHTQRGFLNVHSNNADPFDAANVVAQLQDGDVVVMDQATPLGPPPFYWARVVEPVAGWCVSYTGNFEWLEPEEPLFPSHRVRMAMSSLCAVAVGTRAELDATVAALCAGSGLTRAELRLQEVLQPVSQLVSVAEFSDAASAVTRTAAEQLFKGLRVVEAFSMPITDSTACISAILPSEESSERLARSLVLTWIDDFDAEMQGASGALRRVWQRLTEAPNGDVRGHPYCVTVSFRETRFFAHRNLCFVEGEQAQRVLRNTSFAVNWPGLRLMYIAARKEVDSFFASLPNEILLAIGTFVAPHLYIRNYVKWENERL
jgi:hypothetical protein